MKHAVLSLLVLVSLNLPHYSRVRVAQEVVYPGTPVVVTQLGPKRSGLRWSYADHSCISDSMRVVIRDSDAWKNIWKKMYVGKFCRANEVPPVPEIDFTREMIVLAALGERPTSGYGIVVDKAYEQATKLEIIVRSISPRCGGHSQVLTEPIDVVRVPKTDRSVVFREIQAVTECKPDGSMIIRDIN